MYSTPAPLQTRTRTRTHIQSEESDADPGLWLEVEFTAAPDSASNDWIVVANIDDITAKVVLENKSKDAIDMLFANMSHELKTPLNGIIALSEGGSLCFARSTLEYCARKIARLRRVCLFQPLRVARER